jgi:UDP-glucuronate decarboxylase
MHPADGRVVSSFILQALRNEPITIYGDGTQTRSFCYVDDMVEGLIHMMDAPDDFTGPVNLGNPEECEIRILAETIVRLANSRSRVEHHPLPHDDPQRRRPDIRMARERLEWSPVVGLEEGLEKTIGYFRKLMAEG